MSDVGGVMYDKDAVYINVPGNFSRQPDDEEGEGNQSKSINMALLISVPKLDALDT
jgi:ribosome biogenesis protein BMS1